MFDIVTMGALGLLFLAFKKQSNTQFGVLTPEREEMYRNAMEHLKDPERLRKLAVEFQREGLKAEAYCMRKRADWRGRSPEVRAQHDEIFKRAMQSENALAVLEVASIFENMTATIKAQQLRNHATELNDKQEAAAAAEVSEIREEAATVVPPAEVPAEEPGPAPNANGQNHPPS